MTVSHGPKTNPADIEYYEQFEASQIAASEAQALALHDQDCTCLECCFAQQIAAVEAVYRRNQVMRLIDQGILDPKDVTDDNIDEVFQAMLMRGLVTSDSDYE